MRDTGAQMKKQLPLLYRRNGKPYPPGERGVLEWAEDMRDMSKRYVMSEVLPSGRWVATIWSGVDMGYDLDGPPKIFETTVFTGKGRKAILLGQLEQHQWATEAEAIRGHKRMVRKWRNK